MFRKLIWALFGVVLCILAFLPVMVTYMLGSVFELLRDIFDRLHADFLADIRALGDFGRKFRANNLTYAETGIALCNLGGFFLTVFWLIVLYFALQIGAGWWL